LLLVRVLKEHGMKKKVKIPKPRNPFVLHVVVRTQGAHGVSKRTQRRKDKIALKKEVNHDW